MLTILSLTCIDGYDQVGRPIKNYVTGTVTPLKGPDTLLNLIVLSNSTTDECAPCKLWNSQYVGEV